MIFRDCYDMELCLPEPRFPVKKIKKKSIKFKLQTEGAQARSLKNKLLKKKLRIQKSLDIHKNKCNFLKKLHNFTK